MKEKIAEIFIKKNVIIGLVAIVFFAALFSEDNNNPQETNIQSKVNETEQSVKKLAICDGTLITENCELNGVQYLTYKYYPVVEEVSHFEIKTTYTKEITGYCTLCNDGTRSPSCSTGRGTCSHHGGVAQWNAPIYSDVPHYESIKVIDSPAIAERYEKVIKEN